MDTGCSALVSDLNDLKLTQKNPRDDESNDSHDGFDGEELLAVAEEGLGPDVLKLTLKNARDDDDNDSNSDSDDGCEGAELLAAAEEGLGPDVLLSILVKNPGLIRTGDTVGNTVLHMAARDGDILTVCRLIAFVEERQDEDLKKVFMDGNVDGDTALHLALKNRHRELAYCLIKEEDSTKYVRNNDGKRPYTLAEEAGFSEVHKLLAVAEEGLGPDVLKLALKDARDDDDNDSNSDSDNGCYGAKLLAAAEEGLGPDILLPILVKNPGLIRTGDTVGNTVLHMAARDGHILTVCRLIAFLEERQDEDLKKVFRDGNVDGDTALHLALKNRHREIAYCLIKAEDSTKCVCNSNSDNGCYGAKLLDAAEEGLGPDVLLLILVKNPGLIRTGDTVGNTVLHMAARDGEILTVRNLIAFLDKRQNRDLKKVFMDGNVDGDTALHLALKNRHREVAYSLLKAEWRTRDVCNNDRKYPCELAYEAGFSEVYELTTVKIVHAQGPCSDVEMSAVQADLIMAAYRSLPFSWTYLYHGINNGNVDVVLIIRRLMSNGKELLQHQDSQGETLLHASVKASRRGPLRTLVRFMISNHMTDAMCLENENGDTALHLAVKKRDLDASNCLIKAESKTVYQVNHKGVSPLYTAVMNNNYELIKCMVSYCCHRDHASEILSQPKHATLAHVAIKARSFGILKVLMERLPKLVEAKNEKGWRPLSYAANKGSLEEVTYILTHFPKSAEKYDKDGSLPIHKAVGGGHVSIVEAFLKHCPQTLRNVDKNGRSVLHIAGLYGRNNILTYLKEKFQMDESFLQLKDNKGKTFMDYAEDLKPQV